MKTNPSDRSPRLQNRNVHHHYNKAFIDFSLEPVHPYFSKMNVNVIVVFVGVVPQALCNKIILQTTDWKVWKDK
jgi:hypothetical protein